MKRKLILLFLLGISVSVCMPLASRAQSTEVVQLLLNFAKWEALKDNLTTLKKGYEILTKGYKTVRDISEGNYNLHEAFLDKLWEVSPTVKNYKKVSEIIQTELKIVKEYKNGIRQCVSSRQFTGNEIDYLEQVFKKVTDETVKNLDQLLMIITARRMRMSDEERIKSIDAIALDMEDKLSFVRRFNSSNQVLLIQRVKARSEIDLQKKLEGIK